MGVEIVVEDARALELALEELTRMGTPAAIVMIDGALVMPGAKPPERWVDVRVKTAAGTFAVKRRGDAVLVVAFGNLDDRGREMQERIAQALRSG